MLDLHCCVSFSIAVVSRGYFPLYIYLFQLEDNYSIMMVLPYVSMKRSWAYTCPLHPEPLSRLPPQPIPLVVRDICFGCPASYIKLLLAVSHTVVCMFQCTSSHPLLFNWVQKSVLHVCVSFAALPVGSSVPSFWILLLQAAGCRACEYHWLRFPGLWSPTQIVVCGLSHRGLWNLSGSGIKPLSPALAGGFFTTEPPGKP